MTKDEIKDSLTMRQVVEQYGVRINYAGMCCCPFHGEKHPSMKVYKDSYNCFACGANGDIFSFVQNMDNCDFKTAFIALGGTYEKLDTKAQQRKFDSINRTKSKRIKEHNQALEFKTLLSNTIDLCRDAIKQLEPYSDNWCLAQNSIEWLLYAWELKYVYESEVNEIDVYRKCRSIKQQINI